MVKRGVEERINGRQFLSELDQKISLGTPSNTETDKVGNSAGQNTSPDEHGGEQQPVLKELEADISQMLDNLDFFQ